MIVEPDCGMSEPHLAFAGLADLDLLPLQDLGSAGLRKTDRLHHRRLLRVHCAGR